ncbi:genetransfer agent FAD/FMN-containing dehydrogenase [alpha proteobacterium U9-1i]|nr:genetransfer agent FAD/FMN-containing dehydrogenase [alpha proteobacterium U9-1i]
MRSIPEEMAARLASGVTTLAHVWRITRADGVVFGFTDHDRTLLFDGLPCAPTQGLSAGVLEKQLGLGVDSASLSGALSSDALAAADLARGLWDGARVDLYRVDWSEPSQRVHLFAGHIGEVRRGRQAFEAELRGLQAPLNVPVGRVFSRFCDADVGDARCGVDLESSTFRGIGIVTEVLSATAFRASGLSAFEAGWFARGLLQWDAGGASEVSTHGMSAGVATFELIDAAGDVLTPGAEFTVSAGCDKRVATCRAKFANTINFRGFPHMPGNDAMQAGPVTGQPLDGGSRFT